MTGKMQSQKSEEDGRKEQTTKKIEGEKEERLMIYAKKKPGCLESEKVTKNYSIIVSSRHFAHYHHPIIFSGLREHASCCQQDESK